MKRNYRAYLASLIVILAGALFALAGCGKVVTGISVKNLDSIQSVYVKGQDMDLGSISLSVRSNNGETTVTLADSDVRVSGYDKNTLGKQRVTAIYGGKSVSFNVTVVERIVAENYDVNYFIGDEFNRNKGRLKITENDGTSFTVPISSEEVTVFGFDSSEEAKPLIVDVIYEKGSKKYFGTLSVNIYSADNAVLTPPTKTEYRSHEDINLLGGYITVKSTDGALTRYVEITPAMISGYEPEKVTEAYRTTPAVQTVTITYGNKTFAYDVKITYSDVAMIRSAAASLSALDYNEGLPEIPAELGNIAADAFSAYKTLTAADKNLVSEEQLVAILRAYAVYGKSVWESAIEDYSDVFTFEDGEIAFGEGGYNAFKAVTEAIEQGTSPAYVWGDALAALAESYGETILSGELTIEEYLAGVDGTEWLTNIARELKYATDLYDAVKNVPAEWSLQTLENYKENVTPLLEDMVNYTYDAESDIYAAVARWTGRNDLGNMLYAFCYLDNNVSALNRIKLTFMRTDLYLLYNILATAADQVISIAYALSSGPSAITVYDTTAFIYLYRQANEGVSAIAASSDPVIKWAFSNMTFPFITGMTTLPNLLNTVYGAAGGYLYYNYFGMDKPGFVRLWNEYLSVYSRFATDENYLSDADFTSAVEQMFFDFISMGQSEQYLFLKSLNPYYTLGFPPLAFDYKGEEKDRYYTYFIYALATHYENVLTDAGKAVFAKLLIAVENYANVGNSQGALADFFVAMTEAEALYAALGDDDAAAFDGNLGFVYDKYVGIYHSFNENGKWEVPDLGEWGEKLTNLKMLITRLNNVYSYISKGTDVYSVFLATYENAAAIAIDIELNAPEEVKNVYKNCPQALLGRDWSIECALNYFHDPYMLYLTSNGYYSDYSDIRVFMAESYYITYNYFNLVVQQGSGAPAPNYDAQLVKTILSDFCALSTEQQMLYIMIDSKFNFFTSGLMSYFKANLSANAYTVCDYLFRTQRAYIVYTIFPNGVVEETQTSYKSTLIAYATTLKNLYDDLSTDDKSQFDNLLGDMYNYYTAVIAGLNLED